MVAVVVPVIVLLAIVTFGKVSVPVDVIAPELIVPVVLKLPLVCVKLPVCVSVPVMPTAANVLMPVTPNVPPIVALPSNCALLVISTCLPVYGVNTKLVAVVVPVTVLLAIVIFGNVNVPVLVIAPELIVPVVLKLPLVCVKLPVCVRVPVMPTACNAVVPVVTVKSCPTTKL